MTVLLVGIGGVAGVLLRYGLTQWIASIWMVAAINVIGSFVLGLITPLALTDSARAALAIGLLGGFTTLSTLTVQTIVEADAGRWNVAVVYLAVNVAGGLAAAVAGYALGRTLA